MVVNDVERKSSSESSGKGGQHAPSMPWYRCLWHAVRWYLFAALVLLPMRELDFYNTRDTSTDYHLYKGLLLFGIMVSGFFHVYKTLKNRHLLNSLIYLIVSCSCFATLFLRLDWFYFKPLTEMKIRAYVFSLYPSLCNHPLTKKMSVPRKGKGLVKIEVNYITRDKRMFVCYIHDITYWLSGAYNLEKIVFDYDDDLARPVRFWPQEKKDILGVESKDRCEDDKVTHLYGHIYWVSRREPCR
ncbi:MAG: hypothetical protein HQM00_09635 [Magnetococcales bacterium]|nr:hypothetical protein [Magnetococcales bacterium]